MMKEIDISYRTMFAELTQRTLDAQFAADFPLEGWFVTVTVKDRDYWYFDLPTPQGKDKRSYVGPHSDEAITERVKAHKEIKDNIRERRRMVSTLRRAGLPGPDPFAGDVTKALADAGLFRLRAVLIGSVAFSTYAGMLGVRLPSSAMQTGDADFAQDFAISAEVQDSLPPILKILQSVDPEFRAVPHQADKAKVVAFQNAKGYRVEFLTGNRGSDEYTGKPSPMPALGGASAENMRFLDYLIYEPVRTVLLFREGVNVLVPAPERYAVHKLIVASRRLTDTLGRVKADKDLSQAALLFEALVETRHGDELADAWEEAWERGDAWKEGIVSGLSRLPKNGVKALENVLGPAVVASLLKR
ncbi:nucleotidyltransferase family protein [Sinorhizobium meliloti]|uniref:nucleotidyltransferase family protein n=1 Tax=Rhizobium meliloti TaxID=382 RepID=UPI0020900541|nr:GSU2403 family nucleotidyltransferase fold protein [Sinorhizobium meliloti]MCO5964780.1 GSU2403 family nucleotidyltransferase fold protein [Sinorhizobium meliloti]